MDKLERKIQEAINIHVTGRSPYKSNRSIMSKMVWKNSRMSLAEFKKHCDKQMSIGVFRVRLHPERHLVLSVQPHAGKHVMQRLSLSRLER